MVDYGWAKKDIWVGKERHMVAQVQHSCQRANVTIPNLGKLIHGHLASV